MNSRVAIIGGTGFETALHERFGHPALSQQVETSFGSADVTFFLTDFGPLAFMPRHGAGHSVAPHRIAHRANIAALRSVGVKDVLSTSAVGSLKKGYAPGDMAIVDDFIDISDGQVTLFDEAPVTHTDFTEPFSAALRKGLILSAAEIAEKSGFPRLIIHERGTYVCVRGPRYETPAEVRAFGLLGGDIVGMTVAPEAILAREAGMRYASVSVVTNYGAGISETPLSHAEVEGMMAQRRAPLIEILLLAAMNLLQDAAA